MTNNLKHEFLLDPDITYLNHGSFGAVPRRVAEAQQNLILEIEKDPTDFIMNEMPKRFANARQVLGQYLNAPPDDLVYIPNATFGVNIVVRSLQLGPGDQILTTNHEYGACDNVLDFTAQQKGFEVIRQPISFPFRSEKAVVEELWKGVTANTRLIFLSHMTSETAVIFPVKQICEKARQAGIQTFIDGAHAPGHIPVDLQDIKADYYTGNCHKWMCSPRGAAFLYTTPQNQEIIDPLVVSWGWGTNKETTTGSRYLDCLQWWGTKDPSAYLCVPDAVQFQQQHNWPEISRQCHQILNAALEEINQITHLAPLYPDSSSTFYQQMAVAALPQETNPQHLKQRLYEEHHIQIPCLAWEDQKFIRISIQAYNDQTDIQRLVHGLRTLLPQVCQP